MVCPDAPNASGACLTDRCSLSCAAGMRDCDGNAINGCEINGLTDPTNSGACGVRCSATTDASGALCSSGCCVTECSCGRGDRDGNAVNGCEADLLTSTANCGRCGNSCGVAVARQVCASA